MERVKEVRTTKYRGLLHIICEECEDRAQYYQQQEATEHMCRSCGHITKFGELKRLFINCECGARHNYLTNIKTQIDDVQCHECRQPVAVEWDKKRRNYMTINRPKKGAM